MSAEEHVTVAHRFFAEQDRRKGELPNELLAPGYMAHVPGFPPMDRAGHTELGKVFYAAFPDAQQAIDDAFADDAKVAVRFTMTGTHQGDLMGVPPTGKQVTVLGIATLHIAGGRVAEFHEIFDLMGLMQQIGAVPSA